MNARGLAAMIMLGAMASGVGDVDRRLSDLSYSGPRLDPEPETEKEDPYVTYVREQAKQEQRTPNPPKVRKPVTLQKNRKRRM